MTIRSSDIKFEMGDLSVTRHEHYVSVIGHGMWDADYLERHYKELESLFEGIRSEEGRGVNVLADLSKSGVQSSATAALIQHWTPRLYNTNDRLAMIVASSLMKVQLRRVVEVPCRREFFMSHNAAMTWLLAGLAHN